MSIVHTALDYYVNSASDGPVHSIALNPEDKWHLPLRYAFH